MTAFNFRTVKWKLFSSLCTHLVITYNIFSMFGGSHLSALQNLRNGSFFAVHGIHDGISLRFLQGTLKIPFVRRVSYTIALYFLICCCYAMVYCKPSGDACCPSSCYLCFRIYQKLSHYPKAHSGTWFEGNFLSVKLSSPESGLYIPTLIFSSHFKFFEISVMVFFGHFFAFWFWTVIVNEMDIVKA